MDETTKHRFRSADEALEAVAVQLLQFFRICDERHFTAGVCHWAKHALQLIQTLHNTSARKP